MKWLAAVAALLFVALTSVFSALSQDIGQDLLFLQHPSFPVDEVAKLLPDHASIGILDTTPGKSLNPVKKLLDTNRLELLRVHIFNGPGLTNGQLGHYEPHFGYTNASFNRLWERGGGRLRQHLAERTKLFCELVPPSVTLQISPTLENHLTPRAFREQARVVKAVCPRAVVVSSPGFGERSTPGFIPEFHSIKAAAGKAPCNASLDGDSAPDVDVKRWLERQKACTRFIWALPYNCRLASGSFIDPRARKHCPTPKQLRELFAMAEPLPPTSCRDVPGCRKLSAVQRPRLWKPWAEDKGANDIRANKPLWISPERLSEDVRILACDGREVARLNYYGSFAGGGYRYYSGTASNLYGIDMADKAESISGSPYVTVHERGGQCFGPFIPYLRQGYFR